MIGKLERIIKSIKMSLGYPLVTVELSDEDIEFIVDESIQFLNQYASDTRYLTTTLATKSVDLTAEEFSDIHSVVQVMKSSQSRFSGNGELSFGPGYATSNIRSGAVSQTMPQVLLERRAMDRLAGALEEPVSYRQNGQVIYLSESGTLTIEYVPKWKSVDELDSYWYDVVTRYAEAKCKVTIGRARKKFTSSKALHEIDSSMLEEGNEIIAKIIEEVRASDLIDPEVI